MIITIALGVLLAMFINAFGPLIITFVIAFCTGVIDDFSARSSAKKAAKALRNADPKERTRIAYQNKYRLIGSMMLLAFVMMPILF